MLAAGLQQEDEPARATESHARRFYERFTGEHATFLAAIQGIAEEAERARYSTLTLNRLLFLYFMQRRGFLDGDRDYLAHRLRTMQTTMGAHTFYRRFLLPLLYEGSARPDDTAARQLFGELPRLHGLFTPHELEQRYPAIQIEDTAFARIFAFLDRYRWRLDGTPPRDEDEIDPSILGYIFERHVNQPHMGTYYTREDVTGYIAQNTIIPYLFSSTARACPGVFGAGAQLWRRLQQQPERYIYAEVSHSAPLPGETAREYAARRSHYLRLRAKLAAGEIGEIDDFITSNLDIRSFARDALCDIDDAAALLAFYEQLRRIKILDLTCGHGAFLVAALQVLAPLYDACLDRMYTLALNGSRPGEASALPEPLRTQPARRCAILKAIIGDNLYGVDIMEEATETCKLRLFLRLVAQIERYEDLEPLPDLGANVRTGNTLVGSIMDLPPQDQSAPTKRSAITDLNSQDKTIHHEAGISPVSYQRPFHWRAEFPAIMARGGFDVIIGNPPYVEYSAASFPYTLPNFATLPCANLYPCVIERSRQLLSAHGRQGMIVPLAAFATRNMVPLIEGFYRWFPRSWLSFYHFRPAMLFSGGKVASIPTCIYLASVEGPEQRFSTHIAKWPTQHRGLLFPSLTYCRVTAPRDPANRHYYPKFGYVLENALLEKVLRHRQVRDYLASAPNQNTMYYRSAGGLYWKIFTNFAWPYRTTSNKQRSFQEAYDRDIFVALFNSSLFWWYYTVTFDTFNLKDYMLFGFRFSYPEEAETTGALKALCQRLMDDFRRNAQHLKRGATGSYTIYARKSKGIIDEIDTVLARHYGFTAEELNFIIHYDSRYRLGGERDL